MTNRAKGFARSAAAQESQWSVRTRGLCFRWHKERPLLEFPDIDLVPGQHLFLRGPSGSGKSTLLSLLGGLLRPTGGSLMLLDQDLTRMSGGERDRFRANHIGVIFQQFNLVPYLSPLANVLLPTKLSPLRAGRTAPTAKAEAEELLGCLAIARDHWQHPVNRLSIGQQQRVAAARALIGAPELILADEPTAALDTDNRDRFVDLLITLAAHRRTSVVFVSHDRSLASHFHTHADLGAQS